MERLEFVMEDMIYALAGATPLIAGVAVGRARGRTAGILTGLGVFAAVVVLLVVLGFGY